MATIFRNADLNGTVANTPTLTLVDGTKLILGQDAQISNTAAGTQATIAFSGYCQFILDGDVYGNNEGAITGVIGSSASFWIGATASVAAAPFWGIKVLGDTFVANAGIVSGETAITVGGGGLRLMNEGTILGSITGVSATQGIGGSSVVNAGSISGLRTAVSLVSEGPDTVVNTGRILSTGVFGSGGSGTGVNFYFTGTSANDRNVLDNLGGEIITASGYVIDGSNGTDLLTNTGVIRGDIVTYAGNDSYLGQQGQLIGRLLLDAGNDTAFTGADNDTINGGDGLDLLDGGAGHDSLLGGDGDDTIAGGTGNDTITDLVGSQSIEGGDGRDVITTGSGRDSVDAGAGDDIVNGGDGADLLDGGEGAADMLSYAASGFGVTVNLGTNDASGGYADGDDIAGFEGVWATNTLDILVGSAGANTLRGIGANDQLSGLAGNDRITGDSGFDTITGGLGADVLWGGLGADRFRYVLAAESGINGLTRDRIIDFNKAEADRIDLSAIDANSVAAGNQAFVLTGSGGTAAFSGAAGQLRFQQFLEVTLVQADIDGNAVADFAILLNGIIPLTATDFVL